MFLIVYNHPQAGPVYLAEFRPHRGGRVRCKFSRHRDDAGTYGADAAERVVFDLATYLADGCDKPADARFRDTYRRTVVIPANRPAPIPE